MSIRPATEQDQNVLRDLWLAMQDELETPPFLLEEWEHCWADLSRHVRDGLGFVSEDDGRVTGFAFAKIPRETPALVHVTDLYVAPAARRGGVARSLMHTVATTGQERGATHVGLDVRVGNAAATALYRRLGFADHERFMAAELGRCSNGASESSGLRRSRRRTCRATTKPRSSTRSSSSCPASDGASTRR